MKENNTRREFLKKVAYKAPVVLALGALVAPATANASHIGEPPGDISDPFPGTSNGGLG